MMIMATPVAQKVAEVSLTSVDAALPIMKISRRKTPAAAQKSVERPRWWKLGHPLDEMVRRCSPNGCPEGSSGIPSGSRYWNTI
jgi:hypothetical protein